MMNCLLIALIGELCSGKRTLAKILERLGFKVETTVENYQIDEKEDESLSKQLEKLNVTDNKELNDNGLIQEKNDNNSLQKSFDRIVIYPFKEWKDYLKLKNKAKFRLINLKASVKKRYSNFIKKYSNSTFEDFLDLDNKSRGSTDEYHKLSLVANVHIKNDGTIEDLINKVLWAKEHLFKFIRPNWDEYFMTIAHMVSQRSNCIKQRVGAVVVKDRRILSVGYNGTPSKVPNCFEGECPRCNAPNIKQGENLDECFCIHAEENALLEAGRVACNNGTLYSTVFPCLICTKLIIESGITKVIYDNGYDSKYTEYLFNKAKVKIEKSKTEDKNIIII